MFFGSRAVVAISLLGLSGGRAAVFFPRGIRSLIRGGRRGNPVGVSVGPSLPSPGLRAVSAPFCAAAGRISRGMQGEKERLLGQRGCVVWFTGLSGSGKTTLSESVERELTRMGRFSVVLDGDKVRAGLNSDLAFSAESRDENVRRLSEVAALMAREGVIVMVSAISPYRKARAHARSLVADGRFVEVFVDTPLGECEARDPKSLYKKARSGEIKGFTGIDDPYETPESPDVWIRPLNGDGGRPMGVEEEIREKTRMILGVLKDQKLLGQGEKEKEKVGETVGRGPS